MPESKFMARAPDRANSIGARLQNGPESCERANAAGPLLQITLAPARRHAPAARAHLHATLDIDCARARAKNAPATPTYRVLAGRKCARHASPTYLAGWLACRERLDARANWLIAALAWLRYVCVAVVLASYWAVGLLSC